MKTKNKITAEQTPILVITNERTELKGKMLLMLYQAASMAQLAYMDGYNPDTGEIDALLVGVQPTEDGQLKVAPLAKLFSKLDSIPQYMVPDGTGNYIGNDISDILPEAEQGQAEERLASLDIGGDTLGGSSDTAVQ